MPYVGDVGIISESSICTRCPQVMKQLPGIKMFARAEVRRYCGKEGIKDYHGFLDKQCYCTDETTRGVANLTVPGGQEFHFPHFSSNFYRLDLFFPQIFLIFVLVLALQVGDSPTWEGPGYATGNYPV